MTKQERVPNRKETISSTNGVGKTGQPYAQECKWIIFLHHIKDKLKDLNVREEPINIREENTGSTLFDFSHSIFLIGMYQRARVTKAKTNYWDFPRIKIFCSENERVEKTKIQPTQWEKIFANVASGKEPVSKFYTEVIKFNTPNQIIQASNKKQEQTFLHRRHTDSQYTQDKSLNISCH